MNTRKVKQPKEHMDVIYESSPEYSLSIHGANIQSIVRNKYSNATKV